MRLTSVTIQRFKNFFDPQTIDVEPDVTCLVGKNESGKTTILKALHRLNPANGSDARFDLTTEYPRWRLAPDRKETNLGDTEPVRATFILDADDVAALAESLPAPLPEGTTCTVARNYSNRLLIDLNASLQAAIKASASQVDLPPADTAELLESGTLGDAQKAARAKARGLKDDESTALRAKALGSFATALGKYSYLFDSELELDDEQLQAVERRLPRFFYFSDYQSLPGEADLTKLAEKLDAGKPLMAHEQTVVALLAHAGERPQDFLDEDYNSRKAELQAASVDLSRHAFQYWRQNPDLAVVFDTDNVPVEQHQNGGDIMHRFLKIELRDGRHGDVETNFSTRSSGFQWFFSFFAAFSEYQESPQPLIVLLDEPGTSLHGEAQHDFVRFITDELGRSKQTLYTTHSQHMIDPTAYEKLRAVHDRATRKDPDLGVVVTPIGLAADRDTLLPVESALGYSVSQHLFIGAGHHLAVEGSSDFVYLQRFTEHMLTEGNNGGLDPRLAIIPVGSVENMPVFVALLGRRLAVTALVDGARTGRTMERIRAAAQANGVSEASLIVCADADESLPRNADIEDLFKTVDYLRLYNWAFDSELAESDLPATTEPLLRRLEQSQGKFDHARPAHALTEHKAEFFDTVSSETVDRFQKLFALLNATLRQGEPAATL
jgi:hypothetical protein